MTTTNGIYSTFQSNISSEEGPQSSEEGSGLHSPNFGPYSPSHSDSFRYHQHDHRSAQRSAAILPTAYDYSMSLNVQQPPLLDSPQELPSPNSTTYRSQYQASLSPRNHLAHDFPISHTASPRVPVDHATSMDFHYASSSARPLPGGVSHDPPYLRQQMGDPTSHVIQDEDPSSGALPPEQTEETRRTMGGGSSRETRKEISNVVIACRQCRSRKIRCDSTRPTCHNCDRRNNKCEYDPAPKRRGPDKRPGTRQRSCKKRPADGSAPPPPKRRRTATDRPMDSLDSPRSSNSILKENLGGERGSSPPSAHAIHLLNVHPHRRTVIHTSRSPSDELSPTMMNPSPSRRYHQFDYDQSGLVKSSFPRRLNTSMLQSPEISPLKSPMSPAAKHERRQWWQNFLTLYSLNTIRQEISYLYEDTGYWLCWLNLPSFLKRLGDEEGRLTIQPSFIYAALAMATLMKSSEVESKAPGRERALWLRNNAQIALQLSWQSGWIDATLAEAAFILALYEASAHPHYTPDRAEDSLVLLDNIIRRIDLLRIDASDSEVCIYPAGCVPVTHVDLGHESPNKPCSCIPVDAVQRPTPYQPSSYPLPWDPTWTEDEIYQEECRRLCWSSLNLICNHVSQCVAFDRTPPEFFLANSGNYAILFPGEVLDRVSPAYLATDSLSPKESIWALYCRSMLLWSCTNRMRATLTNTDEQVDLIYDAWQEAQALYDSVDKHTCNLDTALLYMCREYIHNTQITITHTLRTLQGFGNGPPIFKRKHADDWLRHQDSVIQVVKSAIGHLGSNQGYQLTRRPYQMTWFFNQLSICLVLWNYDRTLQSALTVAKSILVPVEVMNSLWPCHLLQRQAEDLRERLIAACSASGIEPPMPPNYTLPSF